MDKDSQGGNFNHVNPICVEIWKLLEKEELQGSFAQALWTMATRISSVTRSKAMRMLLSIKGYSHSKDNSVFEIMGKKVDETSTHTIGCFQQVLGMLVTSSVVVDAWWAKRPTLSSAYYLLLLEMKPNGDTWIRLLNCYRALTLHKYKSKAASWELSNNQSTMIQKGYYYAGRSRHQE